MTMKDLAADEILFNEGDTSDVAYIVMSGKVQLIRQSAQGDLMMGSIEIGRMLGEEALIIPGVTRAATAKAVGAAKVDSITPEEYAAMLQECPKRLVPFIQLCVEQLKPAFARASSKDAQAPAVQASDIKKITVSAYSDNLKKQFDTMEVAMIRLPFNIGGYPLHNESARHSHNHLNIASDGPPLTVSRQHCCIALENSALYIIDLGSRFGTVVNGLHIGRGRGVYKAPLNKGKNTVGLGGTSATYSITITLE